MKVSYENGVLFARGTDGRLLRSLLGATCETTLPRDAITAEGFALYPIHDEEALLIAEDIDYVPSLKRTIRWRFVHVTKDAGEKYFAADEIDDISKRVGNKVRWQLISGDRVTNVLNVWSGGIRYTTDRDAKSTQEESVMRSEVSDLLLFIVGRISSADLHLRSCQAQAELCHRDRLDAAHQEIEAKDDLVRNLRSQIAGLRAQVANMNGLLSRRHIPHPPRWMEKYR